LNSEFSIYTTKYFIIEAEKKYISKAIAWVECIESNVYPTMLQIMGHIPTVNLHVIQFVNHKLRGASGPGAWFEGIRKYRDTDYMCSSIKIFTGKLDDQPPYRLEGDITHETIHGLLDEAKNSSGRTSKWKPIWQPELLDRIFEIELSQRLGGDMVSKRFKRCINKGGNYVVFVQFWKMYGWEPFKSLIIRLHEDSKFPLIEFNQNTFAYYMSLFTNKDVSDFFKELGWDIEVETKEKIIEDLNINE